MDGEGGVWVAMHRASAVRRYDPDGQLSAVIELPVTKVTSCAGAENTAPQKAEEIKPEKRPEIKVEEVKRHIDINPWPKARVGIMETAFRDAHQSIMATRLRTEDMLPICEAMDEVGYHSIEMWGGATFDSAMRFLGEDPWERLRQIK